MAYFTSLWKARIIEKYKQEYENEKISSLLTSKTEIPKKTIIQKWRFYGQTTKRRMTGQLKQWFPDGSSVSNLYFYLKSDHALPKFVLKSLIGFVVGIVLTYLCFIFFVCQLSISFVHATIMSSFIGVLLTLGLAFSCRMRCLIFLLIPQLFSRVGRYTLTCYALVLILTGPATNTLRNSEVLTESMACSQEQIKTKVGHVTEVLKKPFNAMKNSINLMVDGMKRATFKMNRIISKISVMVTSIGDIIQSSYAWLNSVANICTKKFGTPYEHCLKAVQRGIINCRKSLGKDLARICNDYAAKSVCSTMQSYKTICVVPDFATASFAATLKRRLRNYINRLNSTFFIDVRTHHIYSYSSNNSDTPSQIAAGIVTEIRKRADPLLTWLSWSSCITSLFLVLIIFRAKYYQHMFETRSRFDNRYVTKELHELDFKRYKEKRETVLPLNKRERAKYICISSFRLVSSEKVYLTRSIVFMAITTFKLLIHMVADYSLYWVLITMRDHGKRQTPSSPGPSDSGVYISGSGVVHDFITSLLESITSPLLTQKPTAVNCLPDPYPPDLQRYIQIGILIVFLWFFALFEPYGLRFRHVIVGHYHPGRAKSRAAWLYDHILRTRGSFMKLARRKLHREYKYSRQEYLTFLQWVDSVIPCWCLRYILGTLPKEPRCLLCNTYEELKDLDTSLINCETTQCPGVYCVRCFSDIGRLCTICLSPKDYGDMSDVSLEKGSSDESDDSDSEKSINQKKLKGTEKERLIKKTKTGKNDTWKSSVKNITNENSEGASTSQIKYDNLDKTYESFNNSKMIKEPDVTDKREILQNTDSSITKIAIQNDKSYRTDDSARNENLAISNPDTNVPSKNDRNQVVINKKTIKRDIRCRRFFHRQSDFHVCMEHNCLGKILAKYLQFSHHCPITSKHFNNRSNMKCRQVRKISYKVKLAKYFNVRSKIKRRKCKARTKFLMKNSSDVKNAEITQKFKKINYTKINKNNCRNNPHIDIELINSNDKNNHTNKTLRKKATSLKKRKYTFENGYHGIKRFLTYYCLNIKTNKNTFDSKRRNWIRQCGILINKKYNRRIREIKTSGSDTPNITKENINTGCFRIQANSLYKNWFKHKSSKNPLNKSIEMKVASDKELLSLKDDNRKVAEITNNNSKTSSSRSDKCSFTFDNTNGGHCESSCDNSMTVESKKSDDFKNIEGSLSEVSESCNISLSTFSCFYNTNFTIGKSKKKQSKDHSPNTVRVNRKTKAEAVSKFWNKSALQSDWWSPISQKRM